MAAGGRLAKCFHKELTSDIIVASDRKLKPTQQQLGEEFGIGRITVSDILHKYDAYKSQWENNLYSKHQCLNKAT